MESFFSRYKNALVLLVVLVMQLLALAVQAKRPARNADDPEAVSLIRFGVVMVITPPEKALRAVGTWFHDLWFGYIDLIHVRRDNAALKSEVERLRLQEASVVEDARQGQRLQQLLGFKEHYIYQTVPAQVIGTSGTDQSSILYIDKGSNDGLKQDMPVVTQDGIVGRLKDVFPTTSQLMLISDATSGAGVILEATRTRGVLKGNTYGQLQIINVSPDDRIKPGEKVITSGGDQIFPRGLPVGTVERTVTDPDRDPLLDVVVKPAANLSRLEEVLVITTTGDVASSQETKDLAESEAEGVAAQKRASDVLSERLPNRIDPDAPADTNPDQNVDSTGNVVKPLVPPKALHADGFTPGATPPASELKPGERVVPVKNGTEELPPSKTPAAAASSTASPAVPGSSGAAVKSPGTSGSTAGNGGVVTRPAAPAGTAGGTGPSRTAQPAGASNASGATAPVRRPATASAPGIAGTQPAPLTPTTKTHVVVDGPETKPVKPNAGAANPTANQPAGSKPVVRKSPALVPDDGSRPPAVTRPKPPAASQPQPAPQGEGA